MNIRSANRRLFVLLLAASSATVVAASSAPPPASRDAFAAQWSAAGLAPVHNGRSDLVYARPGGAAAAGPALQLAPVQVQMHRDWRRANMEFERIRLRPEEEQQIKDEVAQIVGDELQHELGATPVAGNASGPVLEVKVLDLFINAPEMRLAVQTHSYTKSYGDMVLVAELRDRPGGQLLAASWERPPVREYGTLRLTTKVENAIEVRQVAHNWARKLREDLGRPAGTGP